MSAHILVTGEPGTSFPFPVSIRWRRKGSRVFLFSLSPTSKAGGIPDQRHSSVSNQGLGESGFEAKRSLDQGIREGLKGCPMLG